MEYRSQIKRIAGKNINIAFVPMDSRQKEHQFVGFDYFLKNTTAEYVFPMHMWQDYSGIQRYMRTLPERKLEERVVEISHENQVFDILEE